MTGEAQTSSLEGWAREKGAGRRAGTKHEHMPPPSISVPFPQTGNEGRRTWNGVVEVLAFRSNSICNPWLILKFCFSPGIQGDWTRSALICCNSAVCMEILVGKNPPISFSRAPVTTTVWGI